MISRILPLLSSVTRPSLVYKTSINSRYILQKVPVYQTAFRRAFSTEDSSSSSSSEEEEEGELANESHINEVMLVGTIRNVIKIPEKNDLRVIISVKRSSSDVSDHFSVIVGDQIRRKFLQVGELLAVQGSTYRYKDKDGIQMQDVFASRID